MKKKLLTLGALALTMTSVNAQFLFYVGDKGQAYVKEGALVYNGGGLKTVGTGLIDNSGNIMVVGSATDKFETKEVNGTSDKNNGGNIILRMTNSTIGSLRYGQLYIDGLSQNNITGIVDKEYKDVKHGEYQQMAIPFLNKEYNGFADEIGMGSVGSRWSKNEILLWDNTNVLFDTKAGSEFTLNGIEYYALGSANFDASAAIKTVKGRPYANQYSAVSLSGAGASVDFGANGNGRNKYREAYNTYLQDDFETAAWEDDYGKNIYQFGNPYLTNLDLLKLVKESVDIVGVRYEAENVKTTTGSGYSEGYVTESTSYKAIEMGIDGLVGDLSGAIIKPMQTFVVKTAGDTSINFDELRRFAYTPQENGTLTVTTGLSTASANTNLLRTNSLRTASARKVSNEATVKQLGVIALDANGNELGRTYYYVSPNAITGAEKSVNQRQVKAYGNHIIGTFEEKKEGGYDETAASQYWLYINGANENDFKGKEVRMKLYSDKIKSLKFEIREKEELIADNTSLSNGESFYIQSENGEAIEVKQNAVIAANTDTFGLFYGRPEVATQKVEELVAVSEVKRTETDVVFDANVGEYKVLFADDWNTATVQVFNSRGRLASVAKNVNAKSDFTVKLPSAIGTYVVRIISETGVKVDKKVLKN